MSKPTGNGTGGGTGVQKSPTNSAPRGVNKVYWTKLASSKLNFQSTPVSHPVIDTKRFYEDIIATAVRPALVDPKKFHEQTAGMLRRAALNAPVAVGGGRPGPTKVFITSDMEVSVDGRAPEFIRIRDDLPAAAAESVVADDSCEPTGVGQPSLLPSIVARPALRYHGMPWVKRSRNYVGRKWQGLHDEIEDFVEWIQPTIEEVNMRDYVYRRLESVIKLLYPEALVDVFGSYKTDLYLPTSDIDIVVIGKWPAQQLPLHTLRDAIVRENIADEAQIKVIDRAAVPIIKVTDRATNIRVDISFNKVNGVQSAKLIGGYLDSLRPLKPLVLVLKQFLLQRDLNEVFKGGISSYGLILLVVNFLRQHPCYNFVHDNYHANYGVLLVEFFELYGLHFNWKETAIRIHPYPQYISKAEIAADMETATGQAPSYMCIEDPLERGNDIGRSTYAAMAIMQAFQNAYSQLVVAVETSCQWKKTAAVASRNYRQRRHSSSSSSAGPGSTASSKTASPRSSSESSASGDDANEQETVDDSDGDDDDAAAASSSSVDAGDTAADDEGILCDTSGGLVMGAARRHDHRNRHHFRHRTPIDESESYLGRIIRIQPHVIEYRKRLKQQHAMVKIKLAVPNFKTEAKIASDSSSASRMSASGRTGATSISGGNNNSKMVTSRFTLPFTAAHADTAGNAQQFNYLDAPAAGNASLSTTNRTGGRRSGGMASLGHQTSTGDRFTASDTDSDALSVLNPAGNVAPNFRRHHKTASAAMSQQMLYGQGDLFATYAAESDDFGTSVVRALVSPVNPNAGGGREGTQQNIDAYGSAAASQQHQPTIPGMPPPVQSAKANRTTHGSGNSTGVTATGKTKEKKKQKIDSEVPPQSATGGEQSNLPIPSDKNFVDDAGRKAVPSASMPTATLTAGKELSHRATLGSLPGAEIVADRYRQQISGTDAGGASRADSAPPSQPGGTGRAENESGGLTGFAHLEAGSAVQPVVVPSSSSLVQPRLSSIPPTSSSGPTKPSVTLAPSTVNMAHPQQSVPTVNHGNDGKKSTAAVSAQLPYVATGAYVVHSGADRSSNQPREQPQQAPSRRVADNQQIFSMPTTTASAQQQSAAGILFLCPAEVHGAGVTGQQRYGPPSGAKGLPHPMRGFTSFSNQQQPMMMTVGGMALQQFNVPSGEIANDYVSYGNNEAEDEADGGAAADDSRTTTTQDDDDGNTADFDNEYNAAGEEEEEYEEGDDERSISDMTNKRYGRQNRGPQFYADRSFNPHQQHGGLTAAATMLFPPSLHFGPPAGLLPQQHAYHHHHQHTAPPSLSPPTSAPAVVNNNNQKSNKSANDNMPPPFIPALTQEQLAAAVVAAAAMQQRGGTGASTVQQQQQQFLQSLNPQWLAANMAAVAAAGLVGPPRFVDPILSAAAAGAGFPGSSNITAAAYPHNTHFVHHHHHHGGGGGGHFSQRHHSGSAAVNRNYNRTFNNNNNNKFSSNSNKSYGGYGSDSGGSRNAAGNQQRDNNNSNNGRGGGFSSDDWPIGDSYQRRTAAARNNNNNNNRDNSSGTSSFYQNQKYGGDSNNQQASSFTRNNAAAATTQRGRQQQQQQQQTEQSSFSYSGSTTGVGREARPSSAHSTASASSATNSGNATTNQQRYQQGPPPRSNDNNNRRTHAQYGGNNNNNRSFGGGSKHRRDADSDTSA